jgi:hypothetical protein
MSEPLGAIRGGDVADGNDWDDMAGLSAPARRALTNAGYIRLVELADVSESEIRQLHGMGPKAFDVLRRQLSARGLGFADPS